MILCVCPAPALDVTYRIDALVPGGTNRVRTVALRAGGKAVNVARVLATLGEDVTLLAPADDEFASRVVTELAGVQVEIVASGVPTRRTVAVVDDTTGTATLLCEPAGIDCWPAFAVRALELAADADVVVLSGALPAGVPDGGLRALLTALPSRAVVDTSGAALREALGARPALIKPNADELRELTGDPDPRRAAQAVAAAHGTAVIVSLGADGLFAVDAAGAWHARPRRALAGNPTGAGDAAVAGLARGLRHGSALPDLLADGVALSAAAVLRPLAGEVDLADVAAQRAGVVVQAPEPVR